MSYKPYFWKIALCLVAGFIGRFCLLANANLIGFLVDSLCRGDSCRDVPEIFRGWTSGQYLNLLVIVTTGGFFLTAFFRIFFSRLSCLAVSRLYDEVTYRTSRFAIPFFDHTPVGRIVTRFSSDYGNVFRLFGGPLAEFAAIIFDLAAMIILVTVASIWYLPLLLIIALCNFAIYRLNLDRLREHRRDLSQSRSPSIAHFAETAQGASTIRTFVRQKNFYDRFVTLDSQYQNQRLKTGRVVSLFSAQMGATTAVLYLVMGLAGWWMVSTGRSGIGGLGVAFTFVTLASASILMFFEWMAQFEEAMTGVERLDEYLRRPIEAGSQLPAFAQFVTNHPIEIHNPVTMTAVPDALDVKVENLWLRYSAEGPDILKGVSFHIKSGERVGVIGRTGSGKTSLIQSLFCLYPPQKGLVTIGGLRPRLLESENESTPSTMALTGFRKQIALISQEPTLFRGTLRENLDLENNCQESELIESLNTVGLAEWFELSARNLRFMIEERGRNLSAGERQMICVARCILQKTPVVIMDEATSSIDPQSEAVMVRATDEFFANRTQIIIAHRLTTLKNCDRVLWLENGEVRMMDRPEAVFECFRNASMVGQG